jgi:DNA polymerase-1
MAKTPAVSPASIPKASKQPPRSQRKTLVLLDSHAIIHRAYHALPDFASSKGVPTGALYGLTMMLLGIIEKFKPEYIVACYDLPEPTYRHIAYKEYKAGRRKTDDNLVLQLESSRRVFEAFGIPMYDKPGFEADDMLGTIVQQVAHDGKKFDPDGSPVKVVIASGDMDTMQLVTGDDVVVYTLKKGIKDIVIYDELAVIERFGFAPEFLTDYKGLRGDPSDNIIGIAGIGEKTATIIISTFHTIEEMYEVYDKKPDEFRAKCKAAGLTDRIVGLLENGRDDALFSKTLATIRRDAPINFDYEHAKWTPHLDRIEALFKELEFRSLFVKVRQLINGMSGIIEEKPALTESPDESSGSSKLSKKTKDETKDASPSAITGGLFTDGSEAPNGISQPGPRISKKDQKEAEENAYYTTASDDLKEKIKIATWVLDSNKINPTLQDAYFETDEEDPDKAYEMLWKRAHDQGLGFVLDKMEIPLIPIVRQMTEDGVKINVGYLKKISAEYHIVLAKLEKEIHSMAGMEFNVASPKQLGEVLYDKLGLGGAGSGARIKKTAGGAKSTKESELEKLREAHPIVGKILEYRELAKLLGTYIDVFPDLADKEGRVHPNFSLTGAATGRMSTNNPSIQNIPIKSELGKKIRDAFIAPKGKKLISLDYSQMELRIAAILSGDKNLVEIFANGTDVHTGVAARVFKVPESEVTGNMRRQAKVINFGILYGMGVNALRQNLAQGDQSGKETSRQDAQDFYNEYFSTFSGIATYLEDVKESAAKLGYTKTMFGRRRYFEGIKSKLPFIRASAERMAINAPVQGTLADITKLAMLRVHEEICSKPENGIKLLMQIHDELVFEADEKKADKIAIEIQKIMECVLEDSFEEYKKYEKGEGDERRSGTKDADEAGIESRVHTVPIVVSRAVADSWGDMK